MNTLTTWAQDHPVPATVAVALVLAALVALALVGRKAAQRAPAAVLVASLAAIACTAYSADTSWRFAEHRLGMASTEERAAMFAAAELALFSCALMARQNLRTQGAPGSPGVLVWGITGVQVIPAYSESGFVGGTVRAVVGPVLAAVLWHLAMGIELRHTKGTGSGSLPALLAREARERLLSRLGLATRDRTAEQITRDRWTVKAVGLAAKLAEMGPKARGRARVARRLSVAVGKAQAGADEEQRAKLLDLLAARRHAASLATIALPSPWEASQEITVERVPDAVPEVYPEIETAVPAVPEAVPPGARLLPIIARPEAPRHEIRHETPEPVLAAEEPRTRPEVHAEYVPEETPQPVLDSYRARSGSSPSAGSTAVDPPQETDGNPAQADPLGQLGMDWAAEQFKDELLDGKLPGIHRIKATCKVGQDRAKEIQDGFRQAQAAWRLAGSGVSS